MRNSAIATLLCLLVAACSSSTGGSTTTTISTGGGGGTGASGTGGAVCDGDEAKWGSYTEGPIPCTKNSDCCVIINDCLAEAQIVAAANAGEAAAAWPRCSDDLCLSCLPPAIQVGCSNGVCTGTEIDPGNAPEELFSEHCGVDGNVIVGTGLSFICSG